MLSAILKFFDFSLIGLNVLVDGVFANTTCPSGYHREYRLTFQGTTGSDTFIYCYINFISPILIFSTTFYI